MSICQARVSHHAVRRYAEIVMRRQESLAAADDLQALDTLRRAGVDLDAIRERLYAVGQIATRHGAPTVIADGGRVVCGGGTVLTVRTYNARKHRQSLMREAA